MKSDDTYKFSAILFDLDGVLVDACDLHYKALNMALAEVGYTITEEEHYLRYNGLPTKTKLGMLTEEKGLSVDLYHQISQRKQFLTVSIAKDTLKPNLEIIKLLEYLKGKGIKTGCCSNSVRGTVDHFLSIVGLYDLIDVKVGNDEGLNPKPAPDIFLRGAELLNVPIEECIIVEDSPVGIQAAHSADPLLVIVVKDTSQVNLSLLSRTIRKI